MNEMVLYSLWKRFSARKESAYTPAIAEVKALTEEERLQFLEYACKYENAPDFNALTDGSWSALWTQSPLISVWKRIAELLPAQPEDTRYIGILLLLMVRGAHGREDVTVLTDRFCHCLSRFDKEKAHELAPETRWSLFSALHHGYQDARVVLAILEGVPRYWEASVMTLEALAREKSVSSPAQEVADAARMALQRLRESIEKKCETASLLRPAHDPVETKLEELLRPAKKQERDE